MQPNRERKPHPLKELLERGDLEGAEKYAAEIQATVKPWIVSFLQRCVQEKDLKKFTEQMKCRQGATIFSQSTTADLVEMTKIVEEHPECDERAVILQMIKMMVDVHDVSKVYRQGHAALLDTVANHAMGDSSPDPFALLAFMVAEGLRILDEPARRDDVVEIAEVASTCAEHALDVSKHRRPGRAFRESLAHEQFDQSVETIRSWFHSVIDSSKLMECENYGVFIDWWIVVELLHARMQRNALEDTLAHVRGLLQRAPHPSAQFRLHYAEFVLCCLSKDPPHASRAYHATLESAKNVKIPTFSFYCDYAERFVDAAVLSAITAPMMTNQ